MKYIKAFIIFLVIIYTYGAYIGPFLWKTTGNMAYMILGYAPAIAIGVLVMVYTIQKSND
jgi:hypothetical protein